MNHEPPDQSVPLYSKCNTPPESVYVLLISNVGTPMNTCRPSSDTAKLFAKIVYIVFISWPNTAASPTCSREKLTTAVDGSTLNILNPASFTFVFAVFNTNKFVQVASNF